MPHHVNLRSLRTTWALDQDEVAELLNITQSRVSRYEKGEEPPTLQTALSFQVIFGVPPRRIFPRVYEAIEEAVMRRAAELDNRLSAVSGAKAERKRQLLQDMVARATNHDVA